MRILLGTFRVKICFLLIGANLARLHSAAGSSSRGRKCQFQLDHTTLVEIDHEIISTVICPFPLVQEEHC